MVDRIFDFLFRLVFSVILVPLSYLILKTVTESDLLVVFYSSQPEHVVLLCAVVFPTLAVGFAIYWVFQPFFSKDETELTDDGKPKSRRWWG